jgi:FlaA1/EpsC-like NDP-sugar epimerase
MDGLICAWSAWAAIYLRLGEWTLLTGWQWVAVASAVTLGLPIFDRAGLYRSVFRYTGWLPMLNLVRACLVFGAIYSLVFTFIGVPDVPRTVGLIQPVLLLVTLAASRAAVQYLLGGNFRRVRAEKESPRVLIYGAGDAGRQLAAALRRSRQMELAGFLDDDATLHGGILEGMVIHDPAGIRHLVVTLGITDVLLAIPSASRRRRLEIVEMLRGANLNIRTLPGLIDLASGQIEISDVRPLEIEDLLGRDPVKPNPVLLRKNVTGKAVMVTGAGGSIGSELCRQILALEPSRLILVEASEYALYSVHRELGAVPLAGTRAELVPVLASVQDEGRMRAVLERMRPASIYHAAAYKHVPLVQHNCLEGLKNNTLGTFVTARLAREYGVSDFVLISTDKAVRPTNVMGATKRLAELVVQALADEGGGTCYGIVRFGNVLGSSGSVVPLFRDQIADGGPVTLTHKDVTRYFMTIPEAAQLVLQAGAMATGGEVFVLDMGEPVLVRDLARNMIELSGLTMRTPQNPDGDIEIEIIGLRPGEKLHEELLIGNDPSPTPHERIMRAREHFLRLADLEPALERIARAIAAADIEGALRLLEALVPEYKGDGTAHDLPRAAGASVAAIATVVPFAKP